MPVTYKRLMEEQYYEDFCFSNRDFALIRTVQAGNFYV